MEGSQRQEDWREKLQWPYRIVLGWSKQFEDFVVWEETLERAELVYAAHLAWAQSFYEDYLDDVEESTERRALSGEKYGEPNHGFSIRSANLIGFSATKGHGPLLCSVALQEVHRNAPLGIPQGEAEGA